MQKNELVPNNDITRDAAIEYDKHFDVARFAAEKGLGQLATSTLLEGQRSMDTILATDVSAESKIGIRYRTFDEARSAHRAGCNAFTTDTFIDYAVNDKGPFSKYKFGMAKLWYDNMPLDASDNEIIHDPSKVQDYYTSTSQMVERMFKFLVVASGPDDARNAAIAEKAHFKTRIASMRTEVSEKINAWFTGVGNSYGMSAGFSHGLPLQGSKGGREGYRPNLFAQDQGTAYFIMAYTRQRVAEKVVGAESELTKRIYLNPKIVDTPEVFEKIYNTLSQNGMTAQMKMYERTNDLLSAEKSLQKGFKEDFRGDGIVVYVKDDEADAALADILAIAEEHPDAFVGRKLSRMPQKIAEGIGVGEEPAGVNGKESLTSHRANFLNRVVASVRNSGKTGTAANAFYRSEFSRIAHEMSIDPDNLAFNAA